MRALIDFGVRAQVFPASPLTLIALLQVVAQGWRQERLARNAEEIQALGKELYARVAKMTDYLDTLRTRLDSTVKAFNDTVGSYETRVLVTARKFKELGATSGDESSRCRRSTRRRGSCTARTCSACPTKSATRKRDSDRRGAREEVT